MEENIEQKLDRMTDEVVVFTTGLATEGERSAVVLGAARLDLGLERLLKKVMKIHPGGDDNLFDPERSLSSFSAKIALSFRLGLINSEFEHGLQMIRKIRNDFAHSVDKASLSESPYKDRVMELSKVACKNRIWKRLHPVLSINITPPLLAEFCAAIAAIIANLEIGESLNTSFNVQFKCRMDWEK